MRVLQVIGGGRVGGMETVATTLAIALAEAGHDSRLLVLGPDGVNSAAARDAGIAVTVCGAPLGRPRSVAQAYALTRAITRAGRVIAQADYDVVQTHLFKSAALTTPLARARRRPVVGALHGLDRSGAQTRMMRRLVKCQDKAVVVSEGLRNVLVEREKFPADQLVVVPNGVRFEGPRDVRLPAELAALPRDAVVIGSIGRLFARKGQRRLIEAFSALAVENWNAHLVIVGGGPDAGSLKSLAQQSPAGDRIHLVGEQQNPADWLQRFDLLALTSDFEGFGLVVLEAQLSGVPVVSCAAGGPEDLIVDGVSGRQVTPGQFDRALGAAVDNAAVRRAWAAAAEPHARTYTIERMRDGYLDVYRSVIR